MYHAPEPRLIPVRITELRPTQITVGLREVEAKRQAWRDKGDKEATFLGSHLIPVVVGPKGRRYILDHHHLALALHLENVEHVLTSVMEDLSGLPSATFWFVLAHRNWLHLYDTKGRLREHDDIPKTVAGLQDDPYRSLAGALRRHGGYAKDTTYYSEFLWAEYLRRMIRPRLVTADFDQALQQAMAAAKDHAASYLPGWCGPAD